MDFAQLSTITDATILRGMVVDKLNEIALQSQHISAQAKTLAERDAVIARSDAVIAERNALVLSNEALAAQISEHSAVIAKSDAVIARRDESIRTRDIHIEALTHEIARLRRMQFAAKSERMDPEQRALFDDTMAADLAAAEAALDALKTLPPTIRTPGRRRTAPP